MKKLDLSGQGITSLDAHFPKLKGTRTLLLCKNKLRRLFDKAPEKPIESVEALDLRDNVLDDVPYTVLEIQGSMPNV